MSSIARRYCLMAVPTSSSCRASCARSEISAATSGMEVIAVSSSTFALSVSLAVCLAAGLQAPLPRNQTRLWSRPLVMLLHFLQPIARGWARYQGRLVVPRRPSQRAVQENLDSVALRTGGHGLREVHYWAQQRLDRLALMTELLRRLDGRGWPHRADMAWSEYDVEVYDGRWTKVQLGTVAEEHPQGKQLIRCRLRSRWSLRAKVVFWGLAGLELAALGLAARHHGWPWLVLLSLPLLAGFLRGQERALRSLLIVVLDELAKDWRLLKVWPRPAGIESSEASAAPATDGEQRQPSPGNASQPQGSPSAVP